MSDKIKQWKCKYLSDTIASGTSSAELDLLGGTLVSIITPASLASTTFTITVSDISGGTFLTCKDPINAGTTRTFTVAASGYYDIPPAITAGMRYIKVVFGSSETAKTIKYGIRNID